MSALIAREGPPDRLLSAVKHGDCTLVTSVYQIEELRKVLGRDRLKPYIRSEEADDLLHGLESVGAVVAELPEIDLSPDPKDNPILAAGLAGRADLIVSGDKKDMAAVEECEPGLFIPYTEHRRIAPHIGWYLRKSQHRLQSELESSSLAVSFRMGPNRIARQIIHQVS